MGRPKIELDYSKLDALLQFKATKVFCADYLGISEDTIDKRLREDHNMTFTEYHALKMQRTGMKLQQKAIEEALKGNNTMLIFCLKNLCGWVDRQEVQNEIIEAPKTVYDTSKMSKEEYEKFYAKQLALVKKTT